MVGALTAIYKEGPHGFLYLCVHVAELCTQRYKQPCDIGVGGVLLSGQFEDEFWSRVGCGALEARPPIFSQEGSTRDRQDRQDADKTQTRRKTDKTEKTETEAEDNIDNTIAQMRRGYETK